MWHSLYMCVYIWNLKNVTFELTREKETHRLRKWANGCQGWEGGGIWEEGIVRQFEMVMDTLLYLKWITNKDLTVEHKELCSGLCGSLDGRGVWGRMETCICMAESLPCSPETITTLFVNWLFCCCCFSVAKLCPTLQPYELQHARFLCPSLSPWVGSNTCPLS